MKILNRAKSRFALILLVLAIASLAPATPLSAQLTTIRLGTNSPASAESVLFSIARDERLKTRPDLARRFMRSYLDSVRYYKTQKDLAIRETMKRLRTADRSIAEFDYHQRVRSLPDDGKPSIKGMQLALDDLAKDNPKARNLTVQQLIDLSFLP